MGKIPQNVIHLVQSLSDLDLKYLPFIVKNLNSKALNMLCQLVHNVSYNTLNICHKDIGRIKRKMRKQKSNWKLVVDKRQPARVKRDILQSQEGSGVLSLIITTIIPLIAGLLRK